MTTTTTAQLPPFVLRHLDDVARAEGLAEYTVECRPGSKHGDGFLSNMLAITLAEKSAATQRRLALVCKLQLASDATGPSTDPHFEREVHMYKTVLPLLERLQRRCGLDAATGFFAYPRCYVADVAPNRESIVVLEDLRTEGAALWDKLVPLPVENVMLLMEQLGRFHALSFVLRDQQPDVFAELCSLPDVSGQFLRSEMMRGLILNSIDQAIDALDSDVDKALLRKLRVSGLQRLASRGTEESLKQFGVLCHSDVHITNMMFAANKETNVIDRIVLIDWQTGVVSSPAVDLSSFLMWCTTKAVRQEHFDQLLRRYHSELTRVVAACGSDPATLFSYDNLLAQMREFCVHAIIMAPLAVPILVSPPEEIKMFADVSEKSSEQQTLAPLNASTESLYKERLSDIIADGRRLGFLNEI